MRPGVQLVLTDPDEVERCQRAELEIVRHNLGEIPLVGFAANGEIARDRLYGYTGVLTLFV